MQGAVEMIVKGNDAGRQTETGSWRRLRNGYACRLVFGSGGESSSYSLSSRSPECDRFLPRPRQVISGYSHCLQRFAHCLHKQGMTPSTSQHPTPRILREKKRNLLARVVLAITDQRAALDLPPTTEKTCQLGPQYGALASQQGQSKSRL